MQRAVSAGAVWFLQDRQGPGESQSCAWMPPGTSGYKIPSELDRAQAGCRAGAADTEMKVLSYLCQQESLTPGFYTKESSRTLQ